MDDSDRISALENQVKELEQAVTLLLAHSGHVQLNEYDAMKRHVRYLAPALATRASEEMREWLTRTESVQWFEDAEEIKKFVRDDATVVVRDDVLTLVQAGHVFAVPLGGWLSRNPYTNELHRSAPPKVEEDFELASIYEEMTQYE